METYYDVKQFLLKYGIITYIGNRDAEIALSLIELNSLNDEGVILESDYKRAHSILLREQERANKER
ncbi:YqgQ family protein [Amphibacillus sp. MSJ-3]|uniref:YqgQ family protein n=1 Tax=Amphibacillus sp. MSJ-3 TaxID=2841505 RepID=UPI001C0F0F95|nr:YqgQ family protein [Amphibacillus sp. MSJ-3]MBU5594769.1 YqgQ family protein [Amphibacillus sp. MSJ-3]